MFQVEIRLFKVLDPHLIEQKNMREEMLIDSGRYELPPHLSKMEAKVLFGLMKAKMMERYGPSVFESKKGG